MLYFDLKGGMFITLWKEPPMHPIQLALNRMVDAGLPGAFVYLEDTDGTSQFHFACPLTVINVLAWLVSWLYCPLKTIIVCCQSSALLSTLLSGNGFQ
jgi:hypothetical protein